MSGHTDTSPRVDPPPGPEPQSSGARRAASRAGVLLRRREARIAYAFILPYVTLFLIFRVVPAVGSVALSFADYSLAGQFSWVGLDHYERLGGDPLFVEALRVTAVYTVIAVPLVVVGSLVMALLIRRPSRGTKVFRSIFFLPVMTSLVFAGVIWRWIYSDNGALNAMLEGIGLSSVPWLSNELLVLPVLASVATWARFGFDMLIFLAALMSVPVELEEAARVDGASWWQVFRYVVLPHLRPALFFVVVIETVHSFQVFDVIYVMTAGGPVRSSSTLVFMLYQRGFEYFEFGYAAAIGVVLFAITLVVAIVQGRFFGRSRT
ncbi:carbohydrate ABC transporter membrane protein 1 (CUT1 family) [Haloactinopolyspora alba]|uniref:Carbohydrate ABC transporter membrane protein 1 (CUT1 family) n=1 Tax=Haloactinopolyspora alba TaxID=648780 RepID=A0A2P8DT63_9ACTN|nr:sugar ABC transporter permease [Haloactinopolyspora alba]PSL00406.1 carbohydrate ABC transporter membrane protein 1 (CUT1 family) [Haloactinopolyspora alba]